MTTVSPAERALVAAFSLITPSCIQIILAPIFIASSTNGLYQALTDIDESNLNPIPLHLRNASNKVMKSLGYGQSHVRYPWLVEKQTGKKINQEYMPKNLKGKKYYKPDWK